MARRSAAALLALAACGPGGERASPALAGHEPIEPCVASAPDPDPATGDRYPERLETVSGVVAPGATRPGFAWAHARGFLRASTEASWAALHEAEPCVRGGREPHLGAAGWRSGLLEGTPEAPQRLGARVEWLAGDRHAGLRAASIALRPVDAVFGAGAVEVEIVAHLGGEGVGPDDAAGASERIFACLIAALRGR